MLPCCRLDDRPLNLRTDCFRDEIANRAIAQGFLAGMGNQIADDRMLGTNRREYNCFIDGLQSKVLTTRGLKWKPSYKITIVLSIPQNKENKTRLNGRVSAVR